ncbi:ABC transporter ATP-binding protein [Mechercharimyces sp. CAU 1602]|uniref:ABC transporter ATP-binding protein n=1 Tax=Mechercharimyces sp. CAU 1602 TaxID=2973933 RepID=UPI00216280A7|nr:ABC transporter ATP-binding protein [Mechercharimyces sp. CAU 1602]MCS1351818.1 ABC transporter ATP-binding protein [Mechercharimyces sp. CAU 1602]
MIRTENLSKAYGKTNALIDLNLDVEKGSVFGFIGPNGAGKSTTMQILATLLAPTGGRAWIDGLDVVKQAQEVRHIIGYMPDFFGVYDRLTALEYICFYAAAYGIELEQRRKMANELLELVNLSDKRDAYVDNLSRGMKQRLGLARALVHDPELLILDEPASGLDPRARIEFRNVLHELRNMGKTIMISSHILPELVHLCDQIGVMEEGKLKASDRVDNIGAQLNGGHGVEISVLSNGEKARQLLQNYPQVVSVYHVGETLKVHLHGGEQEQVEVLQALIRDEIPVLDFKKVTTDLEDLFLQITAKEEEEQA